MIGNEIPGNSINNIFIASKTGIIFINSIEDIVDNWD